MVQLLPTLLEVVHMFSVFNTTSGELTFSFTSKQSSLDTLDKLLTCVQAA